MKFESQILKQLGNHFQFLQMLTLIIAQIISAFFFFADGRASQWHKTPFCRASYLKRSSLRLSSRLLWRSSWKEESIRSRTKEPNSSQTDQRVRVTVVPRPHLSAIRPVQSSCLWCEPADPTPRWCGLSLLHPAPCSATRRQAHLCENSTSKYTHHTLLDCYWISGNTLQLLAFMHFNTTRQRECVFRVHTGPVVSPLRVSVALSVS